MMDELIAKIAAQTGQPAETVSPIVGALLAHLGDVLPAPIAHQLAIILGIHPNDDTTSDDTAAPAPAPAAGGLFGSVLGQLEGSAAPGGQFAGASSLASVAQSLLGSYLAERR
jgi:hypothetical protein